MFYAVCNLKFHLRVKGSKNILYQKLFMLNDTIYKSSCTSVINYIYKEYRLLNLVLRQFLSILYFTKQHIPSLHSNKSKSQLNITAQWHPTPAKQTYTYKNFADHQSNFLHLSLTLKTLFCFTAHFTTKEKKTCRLVNLL